MLLPFARMPEVKASARSYRDKPYNVLKHLGVIRWRRIAVTGAMRTITSNFLWGLQYSQKFMEITNKAFTSLCRSKSILDIIG